MNSAQPPENKTDTYDHENTTVFRGFFGEPLAGKCEDCGTYFL